MLRILPLALCFAFILAPQVPANEKNAETGGPVIRELVILPANQIIDDDYFAVGESVEISGIVHGDVYALGGSILIDGQIHGDLLAAGGEVTVSGTISEDARIAGGQVTINGTVKRNLTVAGGDVEMTAAASIQGGMVGGGGNFHLGGEIGKDAVIGTGRLVVSNTVRENLKVTAGKIRLTSKAKVYGDFTYASGEAASIDSGAMVEGTVTQKPLPIKFRPSAEGWLALYVGLQVFFCVGQFRLNADSWALSDPPLSAVQQEGYGSNPGTAPRFGRIGISHIDCDPIGSRNRRYDIPGTSPCPNPVRCRIDICLSRENLCYFMARACIVFTPREGSIRKVGIRNRPTCVFLDRTHSIPRIPCNLPDDPLWIGSFAIGKKSDIRRSPESGNDLRPSFKKQTHFQ